MSKKTVALVLTIVFVFAFASSAFAVWGDSTYLAPANIAAGGTTSTNPHGPYDTTSRKCAVCHAVHNADPSGIRLLRGGGTNPCVVCHISTNAGNIVVYKGQTTAYSTLSENAHNNDCGQCHTVHGVGAVTVGALTTKLRGLSTMAFTSAAIDDPILPDAARTNFSSYSIASTTGATSLSEWCSGCHPYYNTGFGGPTHVMTASMGVDYNIGGTLTQIAWADSNICEDCHASTTAALAARSGAAILSTKNFPHYTDGARFLETSGGVDVAAGQGGLDGVCLKCHVSGAAGVGKTF